MSYHNSVKNYSLFFEQLAQETPLYDYKEIFDVNVYFEDPFHRTTGIEALYAIFQNMYDTLYAPKFIVNEVVCENQTAYIRWVFSYKRTEQGDVEKFSGVSRVQFLHNGKVISHVDYWDAAQHIYEKVPMIGKILRYIKKRIAS